MARWDDRDRREDPDRWGREPRDVDARGERPRIGDRERWRPPHVEPPPEHPGFGRFATYLGIGPKNWTRDDATMREEICERMFEDEHLDPSELEVKVENGEVYLTGSVANRRQKQRAERIAESVGGVHDVHNRLTFVGNEMDGTSQTREETRAHTPAGQSAAHGRAGMYEREPVGRRGRRS